MSNAKAFISWSGGKDSALALYRSQQQEGYTVEALLTNVNAVHNRITMHGVRRELLEAQAAAIGLPLHTAELPLLPSMQDYDRITEDAVAQLKQNHFQHVVFGDIFLEELKRYREAQSTKQGIIPHFPLWANDTKELMQEFFRAGFKAIVVCVNGSLLRSSFCGRLLDQRFLDDLPTDVDPCGENGEYHSFVFDGPIFKHPVLFEKGDVVTQNYPAPKRGDDCYKKEPAADYTFHFCDLKPVHIEV